MKKRPPAGPLPLRGIFWLLLAFFLLFLALPMGTLFVQALSDKEGFSLRFFADIFTRRQFFTAFSNSLRLSALAGVITTLLAFLLAYTIHYTNLPKALKGLIKALTVLPMLLPTITYGFALLYSFGKQGLFTMLFGQQLFEIYGSGGLLLAYVIYTLPTAFLLINNTISYIDKKFLLVSRAMGDRPLRSFCTSILTPLLGTLAASFFQSFTLSFTDYGIPASIGGNVELVAGMLYNEMLGSIPNFHTGAVLALAMLLPSVLSIALLGYLARYNIRYSKISDLQPKRNHLRDAFCGGLSSLSMLMILAVFLAIFLVPFVEQWPYRLVPSLVHLKAVFADPSLMAVYRNSLIVAFLSAIFGTLFAYGAGLICARSGLSRRHGKLLDALSILPNSIPGMVLGVAYLLCFKGSFLQNSLAILIICNVIHFFTSPQLLLKGSLEKLNASWENTARLMGDSWLKTVVRIITPNALRSIVEVFSYFFVNAMVTVSALVFIAGARTMVVTAKIKELQHFATFNEIFVLSILILLTNLMLKGLLWLFLHRKPNRNKGELS